MRRAVILFPSGLTLANLFFGVFAIITAARGDFRLAGIYVLIGGIFDAFDGRVARATNAGSQFGEELDSLVDAISFGLAPAMIMYFAVLNRDGWDWVFVFLFAACAVMRLARFNIEQAGTSKTYFQGLPSPAAGCTLASYYWFSQSWLYNYGAIGNLPWQELLRFLMAALAALMISNIPYPVFPRTGVRSLRALAATLLLLTSGYLLVAKRLEFFFPLCLAYVAWGPVRWLFAGIFERRQPTIPYDLSEGEDEEDEEDFELGTDQVHASRQGRRPPPPVREERPKRPRLEEAPVRAVRTDDRPPRAEKSERPERPQRTEEERAARREKREKRDKRERTPRLPRPERQADGAPTAPEAVAVLAADDAPDVTIESPSAIAEGVVIPMTAGDGAPPRKRKRRRRRGERKERGPADANDAGAPDSNDDFSDEGGSDAGGEDHSPYSAPAPAAAPAPVSAAPAPVPPPSPSPSSDSHE
ncbi:MAG: pssA [Gemmatimonadetes bacterium]|nr:pssA [Gemmatimonadota bacterium]